MSPTAYLVWFLFMAAATASILVIGTLGAAGTFERDERSASQPRAADTTSRASSCT
jgi:hypothetical protein